MAPASFHSPSMVNKKPVAEHRRDLWAVVSGVPDCRIVGPMSASDIRRLRRMLTVKINQSINLYVKTRPISRHYWRLRLQWCETEEIKTDEQVASNQTANSKYIDSLLGTPVPWPFLLASWGFWITRRTEGRESVCLGVDCRSGLQHTLLKTPCCN